MTQAKPFQKATVQAVLKVFRSGRKYRRFLIADEVGLGKTVVAQQVIRKLMKRRNRPLVVFYICSNLSIAAQNRRKLVEILPKEERQKAICHVDRLTLLAGADGQPTHKRLRLYSLTPDTSIPMRQGRRRDGRQEERALIHALVEKVFPWLFDEFDTRVFQRQARRWWKGVHLPLARKKAASASLQLAFRQSVREEFSLDGGKHLDKAIREEPLEALDLIAHLRNALAASAIEELQPDLVIFDEFQRFQDLLADTDNPAEQRVIGRLRGDQCANPPALLLLSATPYKLYSRRSEESGPNSYHSEFFDLVRFLYGSTHQADEKRDECIKQFAVIEEELRRGQPNSTAARKAKASVEQICRAVMARTERSAHPATWQNVPTESLDAPIESQDLLVFKHAARSFSEAHRGYAVPYWTSIPLPMQTMGTQYVAWKSAGGLKAQGTPHLSEAMRDSYRRPDSWPHPRLRSLRRLVPPGRTVTPWLAPSNAWWPLKGAWKDPATQPRKALVFSRFRAVPQAIAASLSFDLEATILEKEKASYLKMASGKLLTATEKRHALLALFHPSPLIVQATDPLEASDQSLGAVRRAVDSQLREFLKQLEVKIDRRAPQPPLWRLLANLEAKEGELGYVHRAWRQLDERIRKKETADSGLSQLLADWNEESKYTVDRIHPLSFQALVRYAMSAPGVVVGRALRRHWPDAVQEDGYFHTLDAAWTGLRNYLDQRWFFLAFRRRKEKYPDVIQRLVIEGNLESVLDEHVWIISRLGSLEGKELANELRDGLSVKSGLFFLHPLGDLDAETFALRCHVAMPFVEARAASQQEAASLKSGESLEEVAKIRTDELRRAFNTPFWPYVLTTTSVGQEGLDFHTWCDTIVHWDLCRNPVDLEQREGRIQRFGGLSIRRAIANAMIEKMWAARGSDESPWIAIERLANIELADASGLKPWWVVEDGGIKRYVFDVPTSEQRHWLQWVQKQRRLYRLALGQPNQEDLLELLASNEKLTDKAVREAAINLSPWFAGKLAT